MDMPSYDEAYEQAQDRPAFSNGTEGRSWMERNCCRCANDDDEDGPGCPLVLVAMMGRTPVQWQARDRLSLGDQYDCRLFSPRSA